MRWLIQEIHFTYICKKTEIESIKKLTDLNNKNKGEIFMTNSALQVTNFDFYGDELIAVKENATDEVYVSINSVLRGIGFAEKQIEYYRKKWTINDSVISRTTRKFSGVNLGVPTANEVWCVAVSKLSLALAKISITPKMKQKQPEIATKLELYQDRCADVLNAVFVGKRSVDEVSIQTILQPILTTLNSMNDRLIRLEENQTKKLLEQKRKFSYWSSKMFPKYQLLMDYFEIDTYKELYKNLFRELQNCYPDIDLNQMADDYCYENKVDSCYTMEIIEHDKNVRKLFENMVDSLLEKYNLFSDEGIVVRQSTIFDN